MFIMLGLWLLFVFYVLDKFIRTNVISFHNAFWHYVLLIIFAILLVFPDILEKVKVLFGIKSNMNILYFLVIGYLFLLTFIQQIKIAKLSDSQRELISKISIENKD